MLALLSPRYGAQRQYDNACPEEPAWIYTDAGEEWLRSCHFNLTHFMDVKIGSVTVIKHGEFVTRFSERRVEEDGEDDQFALDVALIKGERCTKYESLRDKVIHEMCLPLAPVAEMADRDLKAWLES